MELPIRERSDRTKNLVGFSVGGVQYAVDIFQVSEIIKPQPLVPLPHAPPSVTGVADHRGAVVPIIDLRRRFGLEVAESVRSTKWIVVRTGERWVGLVVDRVTEVFGAGPDEQREAPALGVGDEARGIATVYRHAGALVFVIDVDRVAAPAEDIDMSVARAVAAGEGRNP